MPEPIRPRAVLVGVQLPGVTNEEHQGSLEELARLVTTLGYEVVGRVTQRRNALDGAVVLGEGKLEELAAFAGGTGVAQPTRVRKAQKKDLHPGADHHEDDDPDDAAEDSPT
ncbi:MAG: GTPase HflX, partial [Hyphomicrobium sp.]